MAFLLPSQSSLFVICFLVFIAFFCHSLLLIIHDALPPKSSVLWSSVCRRQTQNAMSTLITPFPSSEGMYFDDAIGNKFVASLNSGPDPSPPVLCDTRVVSLDTGPCGQPVIGQPAKTSISNKAKKTRKRGRPRIEGKTAEQGNMIKKKGVKKQVKRSPQRAPSPEVPDEPDDHGDPMEDLAAMAERNCAAAERYRRRKRDTAALLASSAKDLDQRHCQLSATAAALKETICLLKAKLLEHTDCNCALIQRYVAHEAKRLVDSITGMGAEVWPATRTFERDLPGPISDWPGSASTSVPAQMLYAPSPMTSMTEAVIVTPWADESGGWADGSGGSGEVMSARFAHIDFCQQAPTMTLQNPFPWDSQMYADSSQQFST